METMTSQRNLTTEGLPTPNDLNQLKELSNKLNLATRRPSVVQWKQVIEFRKSRGQYLTSGSPQYLDSLVSQRLLHHNATAVQAPAELAEVLDNRNAQVSSNDFHRQLFGENLNTPTKSNNNNMDGITPTPTRRVRRIGKTTIFESDNDMLVTKAADVANNNA
uniref:Uncharacterized protein n=1 Tax=Ciona savignyi TaxID=51511 RepID=H2ZHL7_CIOSA